MIHTLAPPDGNRYLREYRHFQERAEALGSQPSDQVVFSEGPLQVRVVPSQQLVQTRETEGTGDDRLQHFTEYQLTDKGLQVTDAIDALHDLWVRNQDLHQCLVNPANGTLTMLEF